MRGFSVVREKVKVKSLRCVRLFGTTWTVALQASPSMGFSKQEYWSGLPFPSPEDPPNPGIEPGFPHCRQTLYHLSHQGNLGSLLGWEDPLEKEIGTHSSMLS